jgi:hypothetical protein
MVFDANIDAKGDRTDHSNHHTEVSLPILGIAIAVWIFHRKRITKHRRRHAALLALTYSPGEQTLRNAEGGEAIIIYYLLKKTSAIIPRMRLCR